MDKFDNRSKLTKIFDMSLKATGSAANEFDFSELRENMNEIIGGLWGDFTAVEYPGWHATALMIKKKYREEIESQVVEEVYGEIADVSKLYEYYKNNTGSSIGVKVFFNPKVKDWLQNYQNEEEKHIDLGEEVLEELSHFHYTKDEGACIIVQDEKLGENTGNKNDYKFLREVEEKITLQGNTMKTVLPFLIRKVQKNFPKKKFRSLYKKDQIELIHYTPNIDSRDDARGMDALYYHQCRSQYDFESEHHYKVVFKSLDKIAKINGVKSKEIKRGRLKKGEIMTDKEWCRIKKVMEANIKVITGGPYQFNREVLPLGYRISNEGSFVILYDSKANEEEREKLSDIKFPPYEANYNIFYGSADKEDKPQGKTEKFELQLGTHLISNPNSKLFINGQRIGAPGELKRLNKVNRGFVNRKLKKFKYYQDIKLDDKVLRVRYSYDLNGGWIKDDRSERARKQAAAKSSKEQTNNSNNKEDEDKENKNNKETTANSNSKGGKQLYVCAGAELKCSFGDQTSKLQVVSGHNAKVSGNLIANVMDYKPMTNILPFGKCQTTNNPQVASATNANDGHLTPQPCIPNLPAPWAKVKKDVKVGSQAALLEGSKLTCAYGGQIEIVDPGQSILKE